MSEQLIRYNGTFTVANSNPTLNVIVHDVPEPRFSSELLKMCFWFGLSALLTAYLMLFA